LSINLKKPVKAVPPQNLSKQWMIYPFLGIEKSTEENIPAYKQVMG
jgi:hypothetical protein